MSSVVVPSPVKGTVAGFLILRHKRDGGDERLEYQTIEEMAAEVDRVRKIERAVWARVGKKAATGAELDAAGYTEVPADEYFTLMRRDDNGVIEQEGGADIIGKTTKVGDPYEKKFCKSCGGNPVWFCRKDGRFGGLFECETCTDKDIDD